MDKGIWGEKSKYFYELGPDSIFKAVENHKFRPTGRILSLNSMENRVYEIECEETTLVAKFYRPGRWSREQIQEEHDFLIELNNQELPVCPPLLFKDKSLFNLDSLDIYYTLFPKMGGRLKDELQDEEIIKLGHTLARLHQVGKSKKSHHRLSLTPELYIKHNLNYLIQEKKLPSYLITQYQKVCIELFDFSLPYFKGIEMQRIHGDCHFGNILWRDEKLLLVDFDDMVVGPAIQDLWPMIPADDPESKLKRSLLWESYQEINPLNLREIKLLPFLRAMRVINFAAWIAKRFEDPAFQNNFSFFGTESYWKEQIQILEEIKFSLRSLDDSPQEIDNSYVENDGPWTPPIDWED